MRLSAELLHLLHLGQGGIQYPFVWVRALANWSFFNRASYHRQQTLINIQALLWFHSPIPSLRGLLLSLVVSFIFKQMRKYAKPWSGMNSCESLPLNLVTRHPATDLLGNLVLVIARVRVLCSIVSTCKKACDQRRRVIRLGVEY